MDPFGIKPVFIDTNIEQGGEQHGERPVIVADIRPAPKLLPWIDIGQWNLHPDAFGLTTRSR